MADTPARIEARGLLRRRARRRRDKAPPVGETTRRFRAVVAYDGTAYAGFQRQNERVAVQELLEAALEEATRLPVSVAGAGRTDAGVHADGQVVAWDSRTSLPASALRHLCDHLLPEDVRVLALEETSAGFDPQRDAVRKLYAYLLLPGDAELPRWRRVAWQVPASIDPGRMRQGAAHLVGRHDFRAFRNDPGPERRDEATVRTLESVDVLSPGPFVRIEAVGPGFLYMMVRNVTAALVAVGLGEREPGWIAEVLASRDRRRLPPPAPPQGLTLVRIAYADGFGADAARQDVEDAPVVR
jgi:tRNA pseudouridine38-40 synthase